MRVVVVDLGTSNIRSLVAALAYLGVTPVVSSAAADLDQASHVILPGVGAYDAAMASMETLGLAAPLRRHARDQARPLLGVCLGMQLLFDGSEEGERPGLGLIPGRLQLMQPDSHMRRKVPHVGFAALHGFRPDGLFDGLGPRTDCYFTHSYALPAWTADGNAAWCDHSTPFVAAFQAGRVCGAQCHPEKSQSSGLRLLSNFFSLV